MKIPRGAENFVLERRHDSKSRPLRICPKEYSRPALPLDAASGDLAFTAARLQVVLLGSLPFSSLHFDVGTHGPGTSRIVTRGKIMRSGALGMPRVARGRKM